MHFHKWPKTWRVGARYRDTSWDDVGVRMTEFVKFCQTCRLPKTKQVSGWYYEKKENA